MKNLLLLFVITFILAGCASVFSPRYQDITVITPNKLSKVYIDTNYCGQGEKVYIFNIAKDMKVKQLIVETEGYKNEYRVFFQTHRSNWHIMSWIPFGIFLFMPPLFDIGDNTFNYDEIYEFDSLTPYTY